VWMWSMPPRPTGDEGAGCERRDDAALASAPPVPCAPSPRGISDGMLDLEGAAVPAGEGLSSRIDPARREWPEQAGQAQQVQVAEGAEEAEGAEGTEGEGRGSDAMASSSLFCQMQFNDEDMAQRPVDVVVANVSSSSSVASCPHDSPPANSTASRTASSRPAHAAPMGAGIWLENTMSGVHTCRSAAVLYSARLAPDWHATRASSALIRG
jgi:hypothetical protein